MKRPIYDIIDSHEYVRGNCYQHQLSKVLDQSFRVKRLTLNEVLASPPLTPGSYVLSRLKLRTLVGALARLKDVLFATTLLVYEQDPWESFLTSSPYLGSYPAIAGILSVRSFLNTSNWWVKKLNSEGIPSTFVQMWMLPEYCVPPIPWKDRTLGVVFSGNLMPHRLAFFERLKERGVNVNVRPVKSYWEYLDTVSRARIIIRSEDTPREVRFSSGMVTMEKPQAFWIRDIECASRGCFSMRECDDEGQTWGTQNIPTIVPFNNVEEAASSVKRVLEMSNEEADEKIASSVEYVRTAEGWQSVPRVIQTLLEQ